jgi:hypothetical protein
MTSTALPEKVRCSFGMGLDSACIVFRWLAEPSVRDFDLSNLTLTVAMTGDEYGSTRLMMEKHLLPRLRDSNVRLVQVSRASQAGGYVVLDDSRAPRRMIMRGPWALSDEMRTGGTLPQLTSHLCSIRAKGEVLDWWAQDEYGEEPVRHVIGYAAEEGKRIAKDRERASAKRWPVYPLHSWGWDRNRCDAYIRSLIGERWPRSCCGYCCFGYNKRNLPDLVTRWRAEPEVAAQALYLEHTALALNERMKLFGAVSAHDVAREYRLTEAMGIYRARLEAAPWAAYDVRRVLFAGKADPTAKGPVWRSVRRMSTGTRVQMVAELAQRAAEAGAQVAFDPDGIARAVIMPRESGRYPTIERTWALAPVGVQEKQRSTFETHWRSQLARRSGGGGDG